MKRIMVYVKEEAGKPKARRQCSLPVRLRVTDFLTPYLITESQNHRMVGVGRDFLRSSSPTPLPRAGCTGPHPCGFRISPEMQTSQLLWAACSSALSHSKKGIMMITPILNT